MRLHRKGRLTRTTRRKSGKKASSGGGGAPAITFVGAGAIVIDEDGGTFCTAPLPPGSQAGDLGVVLMARGDQAAMSAPAGWSVPAGWALTGAVAGFYKYFVGGETDPTWNPGASKIAGVCLVFRGVTASPLDQSNLSNTGQGTADLPALAPATTNKTLIVQATGGDSGGSNAALHASGPPIATGVALGTISTGGNLRWSYWTTTSQALIPAENCAATGFQAPFHGLRAGFKIT